MMKLTNMKKTFAALLAALAITGTVTTAMTGISASADEVFDTYGEVRMEKLPDKLIYQPGEELDLTGGTVNACGYNSEGIEWDAFSADISEFDIDDSEFNKYIPGTYTIYVSCEDCTQPASFTVTVSEYESYTYFNIYKTPDKLTYQIGEELDLTGGTAFASGRNTHGVEWDSFEQPLNFFTVDASAFNNQVPGTYTIYVSCNDVTDSFDVEVTGNKIYNQGNDAEPEIDFLTGDADGSGKVDIMDAILLNKAVLGKAQLTDKQLKAVDFNHNNKPDSSDSLALMKYIAGIL